jgi:hypothetical protein
MQETAEQVTSAHLTSFILTDDGQSGGSVRRLKPERPVGTVPVVVLDVDSKDLLQMAASNDQQPVQALGADGVDPPFCVGVRGRRPSWRHQHLGTLRGEHVVEASTERGHPPWRWIQSVAAQRRADRGRRDAHAKPLELAFDLLVAPAGVLLGEPDDQLLHLLVQRRPAGLAVRVGPRASDQPPMPAQQRLGLDEEARPTGSGSTRLTAASRARSAGWSLGRWTWRRSTARW